MRTRRKTQALRGHAAGSAELASASSVVNVSSICSLARRCPTGLAPGLLVAGLTVASLFQALDLASRLVQTSDSAQSLVAADAVVRGNVLLTGWHFPLDDYYFTDTIPYAAFEWLLGPRPFLLVLVPAVVYALLVLVALIACASAPRPLAGKLEACAAVTLMLAAPACIAGWNPLLLSDMHMATVTAALVALALIAHIAGSGPRGTEPVPGAGAALLVLTAAIIASDPFSLVFGFGPALAILAAFWPLRSVVRNRRIALAWFGCGIALGMLLPSAIALAGGFTTESDVLTGLTAAPARNLLALFFGILTLFGANPFTIHGGPGGTLLLTVRCMALAVVVLAIFRVARHLFARSGLPLFDRLLCAGILSTLVACAVSAQFAKGIVPQTLRTGGPPMRFIVPAVIFGAVLAGRQLPDMLATFSAPAARNAARGALAVFAAFMLAAGTRLSTVAMQPRWIDDNPPAAAARWLESHRLFQGVGEYWSSNLITAMSGEAVRVRTVVPLAGRLVPYVWVEDARWYAQLPQFAIWHEKNQTNVTLNEVRATYLVCGTAVVAGYSIAVLADGARAAPCGRVGSQRQANPFTVRVHRW